MKTFLLLVFLACWGEETPKVSPAEQECRQLVLSAYGKVAEPEQSSQNHLLEFKTTTYYKVPGESQVSRAESLTRMERSGKQVYLENEASRIVKDEDMMVAVLKEKRQILVAGNSPLAQNADQLQLVRDLLLNEARLTGCQAAGEGTVKEIAFTLPEHLVEQYRIKAMTFWVDVKLQQVKKVELRYAEGQPVERHVVAFLRQEQGAKPAHSFKSPLALVFDAQGKLLPAYKGFTLSDYRNK